MKFETWYDVKCERCLRHLVDFGFNMAGSRQLARQYAKQAGFSDVKVDGMTMTLCSLCRKEQEKTDRS